MDSPEKRGPGSSGTKNSRTDRLSKALQANISRRKAQVRGRNAQSDSSQAPGAVGTDDPSVVKDKP